MLPQQGESALAERLAVGALILRGIGFVGTHQNSIQGAVVLAVAVISTLLDGTFDALVSMAIHSKTPPFLISAIVWLGEQKIYAERNRRRCFFLLPVVIYG